MPFRIRYSFYLDIYAFALIVKLPDKLLGTLMTIIFIEAFRRWHALLQMTKRVTDPSGDEVLALAGDSVVAPVAIR